MFLVRWFIGIFVTIPVAVFSVLNRHTVDLFWNPIGDDFITLPVWAVALVSLIFGFLLGGFLVWLNSGKVRSERRKQKRDIRHLETEVQSLKKASSDNVRDDGVGVSISSGSYQNAPLLTSK